MHYRTRYIIILLVLLGIFYETRAQSTLSAGDIAITGFNFDNPDEWSFVVLVPIEGGTDIKFTDDGWRSNNSFRNKEGILTWTAPAGGIYPGTEVTITDNAPYSASLGTATETLNGGPDIRGNGDQILAYQGTEANPTFIYAINSYQTGWQANATNKQSTSLPLGLTDGTTAVALAEIDNAVYTCASNSDSKTNLLTAISTIGNWTGSDGTLQTLPPACSFTVCSYNYGSISGTTSVLCGQASALSISGQDAGATLQWMWKEDTEEAWKNANNSTGTTPDYGTAYLGEKTLFMIALDKGGEICYTDTTHVNITGACDSINVWTGLVSSDWTEPLNWSLGVPRQDTDNVYIGNEYAFEPNTTNGTNSDYALNLFVQNEAVMNVIDNAVNGALEITGDIIAEGTINHTGTNPVTVLTGGGGVGILTSGTGDMSTVKLVSDGDFDLKSNLTLASLTISSSVFDLNTFTLTVAGDVSISGGTLDLRLGKINVGGNWNNTGGSVNYSTNATVEFNGATSQAYTSNGQLLLNVIMNTAGGITLSDDCTITGKLTMNSGIITTNGNLLRLFSPAAADLEGGSSTSFINGMVRKSVAPGAETYSFPVGKGPASTDFMPAELITNNLVGPSFLDVSVGTILEEAGNNSDLRLTATQNGTPIINVHEDAVWTITPDIQPVGGSYDLKLWINNVAGLEDNKFTILSRPDASTDYAEWVSYDATTTIPGHGQPGRTVLDGYAIKYGLTSFSQKAPASGNNNLPISLLEFNATALEEEVLLEWSTVSETNNDFFTVERSIDGTDFETIATIEGAGTSNQLLEYATVDENPIHGISYYRLKQTDYDGSFEYAKTVAVAFAGTLTFAVWPNPATDRVFLKMEQDRAPIHSEITGQAWITVYNAIGERVMTSSSMGSTTELDITRLDKGSYSVHIHTAGKTFRSRFIKE